MAQTFYALFGVSEDASVSELRSAYRRLIQKAHPDVRPDDPVAARRARQLNRAIEILTDSTQRSRYDEHLRRRRSKSTGTKSSGAHGANSAAQSSGTTSRSEGSGTQSESANRRNASRDTGSTPKGGFEFSGSGRKKSKKRSPFGVVRAVAGIVFGGFIGIGIASVILWAFWGLDPLGVIAPLAKKSEQQARVKDKTNAVTIDSSYAESETRDTPSTESGNIEQAELLETPEEDAPLKANELDQDASDEKVRKVGVPPNNSTQAEADSGNENEGRLRGQDGDSNDVIAETSWDFLGVNKQVINHFRFKRDGSVDAQHDYDNASWRWLDAQSLLFNYGPGPPYIIFHPEASGLMKGFHSGNGRVRYLRSKIE